MHKLLHIIKGKVYRLPLTLELAAMLAFYNVQLVTKAQSKTVDEDRMYEIHSD